MPPTTDRLIRRLGETLKTAGAARLFVLSLALFVMGSLFMAHSGQAQLAELGENGTLLAAGIAVLAMAL